MLIILVIVLRIYWPSNVHTLNERFYSVEQVCHELNNINKIKDNILNEVINVNNQNWKDWPEKNLYATKGTWKIFPFYAFGVWANNNCKKCPHIYNFLNTIPNLKLATLSKLSPKMKLIPHMGWGNHSNNVIRCHYGLIVPSGCYISVEDEKREEIQYHKKFKWLLIILKYASF